MLEVINIATRSNNFGYGWSRSYYVFWSLNHPQSIKSLMFLRNGSEFLSLDFRDLRIHFRLLLLCWQGLYFVPLDHQEAHVQRNLEASILGITCENFRYSD
jgi:hypothetical protein